MDAPLVDDAIKEGGTFYLPYGLNATPQQLREGIPTRISSSRRSSSTIARALPSDVFYEIQEDA